MDLGLKGISFDRGIDRIIPSSERPQGRLPTEGRLLPSDSPVLNRLEQVVKVATVDETMRRELTPAIPDRAILMPEAFNRALRDALDGLEAEAARHPEHAQTLREAAATLRDEVALRELVDHYRSVLLKG